MLNRREFSTGLLVGVSGAALAANALAQGAVPVEGTQYVRLSPPLPVPQGKIEVIEFFWYGCPHCNAFEPSLDAWQKNLPADVAFRRVPVAFRPEPFVAHQKIFYALEAMDLVGTMHRKVFYAIHHDRRRLDKPDDISAFMAKNGVDPVKFMANFNSFSTAAKARQAAQLAADYKIDGVPAIGVQGRYYTSAALANGAENSLAIADYLIQKVRQGG